MENRRWRIEDRFGHPRFSIRGSSVLYSPPSSENAQLKKKTARRNSPVRRAMSGEHEDLALISARNIRRKRRTRCIDHIYIYKYTVAHTLTRYTQKVR